MPDVVIGRVGYDNFLVVESNKRKIAVIDATKTLLAVHQTTKKGGNFESRKKLNKDYNNNLIAKIYKTVGWERQMLLNILLNTILNRKCTL